jgi:hypothetical protein
MDLQAAFIASLWVVAIIWCVFGWAARQYLWDLPKPGWADLLLLVLGGPVVWVISAWRGLQNLRDRVLGHYGVAGYQCCGGRSSCRHNPHQRSIDRLTNQ